MGSKNIRPTYKILSSGENSFKVKYKDLLDADVKLNYNWTRSEIELE